MEARLLQWCKELIAFPSVTTHGTRRIAEFCAARILAPSGIEARLVPSTVHGADNVNLIAVIPGREAHLMPLVFNTHLDTVPPGDPALWTACGGDPFDPHIEGERIHGLGAADTKLDFAAKVTALAGRQPRRTVHLIGTFGEEQGLLGAKEMASRQLLPRRGLAYVGEPSNLSVVTAHKGLVVFELRLGFSPLRAGDHPVRRAVFRGRSSHSSTPHLGRSAIKAALDEIIGHPELEVRAFSGGDAVNKVAASSELLISGNSTCLSDGVSLEDHRQAAPAHRLPHDVLLALKHFIVGLERFAEQSGPSEDDYTPPTLTCNPGVVRSSPGELTLEFELRPPPSLPVEMVRDGVRRLAAELEAAFSGLSIGLRELRVSPGYRVALDAEVVTTAMQAQTRAGIPVAHSVKTGCTEAGVYAAAGLEPVVFGPGPFAGNIHAPNEYNLLGEVEAAARFYAALLEL